MMTIISVAHIGSASIFLLPYGNIHRIVFQKDSFILFDEIYEERVDAEKQYVSFIKTEINPSHPDSKANEKLKKRIMVWDSEDPPERIIETWELDNFYDNG